MVVCISDLFDLDKIIDSGQCFRAVPLSNGVYRFITGNQVLYIQKISADRYEVSCGQADWEQVWRPYFDLNRDYRKLCGQIPKGDGFLRLAAETGAGIRILRQDAWEMLITFLISQRKSIPAIRSVVELLSRRYGTEVQTSMETLYTFPTPVQMQHAHREDYIACKAGYRAPYLCDAVEKVLSGTLDLDKIGAYSDDNLLAALEGVKGVGVKVANCVALFAYGRTACAPVDTWIQKVIQQEYGGRNPFKSYGAAAGIMQQYFFYYAQKYKLKPA